MKHEMLLRVASRVAPQSFCMYGLWGLSLGVQSEELFDQKA